MEPVSIRTRLTGRVMPSKKYDPVDQISFNPHPANRPGDASNVVKIVEDAMFQSAPG